jgi:two-component system sensor kinase FixL
VQTQPLRVFVVEDDADACDNLRDILEFDEHDVTTVSSARDAFTSSKLPQADVVLLDWKLPDASALDILPQLAIQAPQADVVIITGYGDFDRAVSALREGAADYLLKPINPDTLRASIRRLAVRRQMMREKARSEELFRHLVEAAPCLILILRRDLSVLYFSSYAEHVTGYSSSEMVNRNFADLLTDDQQKLDISQAVATLAQHAELAGRELELQTRDGCRRWLIWNARVLNDFQGESAILAVGQDLTEQKHAIGKLVQAERLAAIGEAMTGLAHESRNALQRSQAFLETLAVEVEGQPSALQLISRLQKAQNELHQLYEEVRQYAAPLKISRASCQLRKLIEETWVNLDVSHKGRDAAITFEKCEVETLTADRFLLQQVIRNILENSLAACSDPVLIRVNIVIAHEMHSRQVRISLSDNGPGLTSEQRQRIFEPFYTTKTRGTGLGMTLSKRIVEAHGGALEVGPGPGAGINIVLPV